MCLQNLYNIAGIASGFIALIGLIGLFWYVIETRKMRIAAQGQVESMIRPAVLLVQNNEQYTGIDSTKLLFKNLGAGVAINVRWRYRAHEHWNELPAMGIGATQKTGMLAKDVLNNGGAVVCEFSSLSGSCYRSISALDIAQDFEPRHLFESASNK